VGIYVVPAGGGAPRELQTGLAQCAHPVWSPDGKHILVYGSQAANAQLALGPIEPAADWWILPAQGGRAKPTGSFAIFQRQGLAITSLVEIPRPVSWIGDSVIFSARWGETVNLWRIRLSEGDLRALAPAERLTSGTALEAHPSLSAGGRLVFASLALQVNLWKLPIDVGNGKAVGGLQRLTEGSVVDAYPSVCPDGSRVVFSSTRPGSMKPQIWMKELGNGRETLLAANDSDPLHPVISPDCSKIVYTRPDGDYLAPASGGPPERLCTDCSMVWDWSPDNQGILFSKRGQPSISFLTLAGKKDRIFLKPTKDNFFQARFSPDGAWVTFLTSGGVWVAPLRNGVAASEREWFPITEEHARVDKPRWSADGTIIYYTSQRDGFLCLWAQRLDRASKRPVSPPWAVYHFHTARLSMTTVGLGGLEISVAKNMIVLNLGELMGNIWASP